MYGRKCTVQGACLLYNSGYMDGHHDTVEAVFTDIVQSEMEEYHLDVVEELLGDFPDTFPATPDLLPQGS